MHKPLKILSLPVDRGGCGWYRIRQPFEMINANTNSDAHVIDKESDDMLAVADSLSVADIIVVRQGGERGKDTIVKNVEDYGKEIKKNRSVKAKWVYDIDDNMEIISPYSEHYKEYGLREYFDKSTLNSWLWQNGKNGFDLKRNRHKVISFMRGLMEADLITTTTPKLAEYARRYNKSVVVLPNMINTSHWFPLQFKKSEQLRIGWSGGHSHYEDWYTIREPLNQLMRKHRFTLVLVGTAFTGLIDKDLQDQVEVLPWVPFEAHSYRMMCARLDIAIIPLAENEFNQYKSPVKLLEMSSMGIPSVVANITPYKEVLDDEFNYPTSLPYNTPQEFFATLESLIKDPALRKYLGNNALNMVREKHDAAKNAHLWIDAYEQILDKDR